MIKYNSNVLYGRPGSGKSFLAGTVLPDAVWICTQASNVAAYNEEAEAKGLTPIKRIVELDHFAIDDEGHIQTVPILERLDAYLLQVVKAWRSGKMPKETGGLVIDELSVIANWLYEDMQAKSKNGFENMSKLESWVQRVCAYARQLKMPVIFICHTKDPSYHTKGAQEGKLKYAGGPAMPIPAAMKSLCAMADTVLHVDVRKRGTKHEYILHTKIDAEWERKVRTRPGTPAQVKADLRAIICGDALTASSMDDAAAEDGTEPAEEETTGGETAAE